jgi:di/tricarboxylate transporter
MMDQVSMWLQSTKPVIEHQSLAIQIPEVIGIPLIAFLIVVLIKEDQFTPEGAAQIGMELSILAAGACGSIFANDTLFGKWGIGLIIYGILVALLCILFAAVLSRVNRKQRQPNPPTVSVSQAVWHPIVGAVPLGLVTTILILGYTWKP